MADRQSVLWAAYDKGRALGHEPGPADAPSTDMEVMSYFFFGYWDLHEPRAASPKRLADWSKRKVFDHVG